MRSGCKYIQVPDDLPELKIALSCSYFVLIWHCRQLVCLNKVGTIGRIAADEAELALNHGSAEKKSRLNPQALIPSTWPASSVGLVLLFKT